MNEAIMICMSFGAVLGGLDRMLGNRFGLGVKFEEGFQLLGSIGLSMAGILCLAPVLAQLLENSVSPVLRHWGIDPGMLGGLLAIDMGGYPLAMELAANEAVGKFAGILVSATFGCTIVFTIPVGMGAIPEADKPCFAKGLMWGLISLPGALLLGGVLSGLAMGTVLMQSLPILAISALLLVGILKWQEQLVQLFAAFAKGIQWITTFGLTIAAVEYMTGFILLPGLSPLSEAMEVVCGIAIVMLGSLPLAEVLKRLLHKPFQRVSRATGMNAASTLGLLVGAVSVTPALVMMKDMDDRGKVVNAAFLVCGASSFAAHLGYTVSAAPEMTAALLAAKLLGGVLGAAIALAATKSGTK